MIIYKEYPMNFDDSKKNIYLKLLFFIDFDSKNNKLSKNSFLKYNYFFYYSYCCHTKI